LGADANANGRAVQTMAGTSRDAAPAQFGPVLAMAPVVNPPDPINPGTLAETAQSTALAHRDTYP
jgi:hypothetical protein